ncbi:hypothetical protein POKO110462_05105 [Pontibacter korlensis]|uniref:Outer membrane protein beta-barrel domain-containing protein n=1 Tax=Pontibacter korlensis TaxID=400092 RepID=A0A0E3ZEN7_9BACT|nr:hypothetical protein [Pontibacter korlensis]AKD03103.1 hypothetical protein PKOR_08190 [Pontibacter korlensis]
MSSATNDKRGSLEEEFRRRMQDAEASPSADLWDRIDHSLTVQENGHYKRGMLFYRQLAAACVTLLLIAGGFAAYYFSGSDAVPASQVQLQTGTIAATAPATRGEEQTTETEGLAVDEAIAEAMQKAVQPQELFAKQGAAPDRSTTISPNSSSATSISTQKDAAPAIADATTTNPGAWHSVPDHKYSSILQGKQDSRESMGIRSMFSRFENVHRTITRPSSATAGFNAERRTGFAAGSSPEPTDDFKRLNEIVMNRMKQLQAEQEAVKQMYKSEKALAVAGSTEKEQESVSGGRWSLGMAYAPSYFEQNIGIPTQLMMGTAASSFASFAPPTALQESARLMDDAREEYEEEVEPGFSFGIEAKAGFKIGKKWKLLSGLGFTQNTARSKSSYVIQQFWRRPGTQDKETPGATTIFLPSLSSNFASDSLSVAQTNEFNVLYRYRHLTVPVGMQYEGKLGKDWFWFAGAGVAANILVQTSIIANSAEVRDIDYELNDEKSPFRKLQWSGNVTAGVGKRLTNNISVAIGPEYRGYFDTMLSSPEKAQAPQGKPYTMGINMAVNYELGSGRK